MVHTTGVSGPTPRHSQGRCGEPAGCFVPPVNRERKYADLGARGNAPRGTNQESAPRGTIHHQRKATTEPQRRTGTHGTKGPRPIHPTRGKPRWRWLQRDVRRDAAKLPGTPQDQKTEISSLRIVRAHQSAPTAGSRSVLRGYFTRGGRTRPFHGTRGKPRLARIVCQRLSTPGTPKHHANGET